jgi:hypothetical protein
VQGINSSSSSDPYSEKPMAMDDNGYQLPVYVYTGETPWLLPPPQYSDDTVFHNKSIDNATSQIRQFAGTTNLGFSISEDKHNEINKQTLISASISLMVVFKSLLTQVIFQLPRKELMFSTSIASLLVELGANSTWQCRRQWEI